MDKVSVGTFISPSTKGSPLVVGVYYPLVVGVYYRYDGRDQLILGRKVNRVPVIESHVVDQVLAYALVAGFLGTLDMSISHIL